MAIPTLIPTVETLPDSLPRDYAHHHVSLGLSADEGACGEDKLGCRRMEAEPGAGEASPTKKVKTESVGVEAILKETAEIELVLVGMAALRGGAPPTPVECHLAVKAYSNLEGLVERVAPRDLASKRFLQSLIQQVIMSRQPNLPLESTPAPAQDVSTSSIGALATSVKGTSAPGKRARDAVKTAKPRTAAKRSVSKNGITRFEDPQSVPITGNRERVGTGPKSFIRGHGAKVAQPLFDQRQVHQQIALEIQQLIKPDAFMGALSESAGAYINSSIRCGLCEVLIRDTRSVLICDGCEAGFHLPCLQMHMPSDFPEKDWYCTKCEAVSGGQRRQSIYGRVRHGPGRRGSSTTWILKTASEQSSAKVYPSTTASEYMLKLRNRRASEDENVCAAKAYSVVHAARDTRLKLPSKTSET